VATTEPSLDDVWLVDAGDRPVRPSRARFLPHCQWLLAALLLAAMIAIAIPSFRLKTPALDEGMLLAYPVRILHGDVPLRDFESFYGPGSFYAVAAAFAGFGQHLVVERLVGLLYHLAILLALFGLALPWGRLTALLVGTIAGFILLIALALPAYAFLGAVACLLGAIWLATSTWPRPKSIRSLSVGVLCGLALLFRFDAAIAVALLLCAVAIRSGGLSWRWALGGLAATGGLYLPYVLIGGWTNAVLMMKHIEADQPWRTLPIPGVTTGPGAELAVAIGLTILFGLLALRWLHLNPESAAGRRLLALGAMTLGFLPYAIRRADPVHVTFAVVVVIAFAPVAAVELLRMVRPGISPVVRQLIVAAAVLALTVAALGARPPGEKVRERLGLAPAAAYRVAFDGRYYYDESPDAARALNQLIPMADRLAGRHGSLFVGQLDMRRADYNDVAVYFLLSGLHPATRYMELDPGGANNSDANLAKQIAAADVLLLTSRYDGWGTSVTASSAFGPSIANEVVRKDFCRRASAWEYVLLQRCR
jgi:hypothetical protein